MKKNPTLAMPLRCSARHEANRPKKQASRKICILKQKTKKDISICISAYMYSDFWDGHLKCLTTNFDVGHMLYTPPSEISP